MFKWALTFLIVTLIAAVIGYSDIALMVAGAAKFIFFIFGILFVVTLIMAILKRPHRPEDRL